MNPPPTSSRQTSCALCQRRKIKCDRKDPCSACIKSGLECVMHTPTRPRGRPKRSAREIELLEKCKRYEELLKANDVKIDSTEASPTTELVDVTLASETSKLTVRQGDGFDSNAWTSLSSQFRDSRDILEGSSENEKMESLIQSTSPAISPDGGDLLFGISRYVSLSGYHPSPVHIFKLWQIFLDNIHPLTKLLHSPTAQQHVVEAASGELGNIPPGMEALMFIIYFSAVISLSNSECETALGEKRDVLVARYKQAAQLALANASFLRTSDIVVIQALVLYLVSQNSKEIRKNILTYHELSIRQYYDPRTLWVLAGVAVRIGQRCNLHRDPSSLGFNPFESEMRRRLWWQIELLEGRATHLSNSKVPMIANGGDTMRPLNVNDSDLTPHMTSTPIEHVGISEMSFCHLRYDITGFLRAHGNKENAAITLQNLLHRKYQRHCDPSIPFHRLINFVVLSFISKLKFLTHHPRRRPHTSAAERTAFFREALNLVILNNKVYCSPDMQRFLWHVDAHFQLDAFVYVLSEIRHEEDQSAWDEIAKSFDNRQEMINTESTNALYKAIQRLAVESWDARPVGSIDEPNFLRILRTREYPSYQVDINELPPIVTTQDTLPMLMDWSYWDDLLTLDCS